MKLRKRFKQVVGVLVELVWRLFGVGLFILGGSAAAGAYFTGDLWVGVLIAWSTVALGIVGAVGYSIAVTGEASKVTVAKAAQDAVQKLDSKNAK